MLRHHFNRRHPPQHLDFVQTRAPQHPELARRHRARLVEHHRPHAVHRLPNVGVVDQNTVPRSRANGRRYRQRRRNPQRARARNHQHGNRVQQGRLHRLPAQQPPAEEGPHRQRQHHRNEDRRHPVHAPFHARPACQRPLYRADHLRQRPVLAHLRRRHRQRRRHVQTAAHHAVPRRLAHRPALPRDHRFIHQRMPLRHKTVRRHALPHLHHKRHPALQPLHAHPALLPAVHHPRLPRHHPVQQRHRPRRPRFRPRLQQFPNQHERDNRARRVEVKVVPARERRKHAEPVCRQNAQRQQRLHPQHPLPQPQRRQPQNRPRRIKHCRRRQHHQHPRQIRPHAIGNRLKIADVEHAAQRHYVHPNKPGHAQPQLQVPLPPVVGPLGAWLVVGHLIPQPLNALPDPPRRHPLWQVPNLHQVAGKQHLRRQHAPLLPQHMFDQPRARRAPHPVHLQRQLRRLARLLGPLLHLRLRHQPRLERLPEQLRIPRIHARLQRPALPQNRKNMQAAVTAEQLVQPVKDALVHGRPGRQPTKLAMDAGHRRARHYRFSPRTCPCSSSSTGFSFFAST